MRARGALLAALVLAGCDLTEVTIVESEDVVVVEGLVQVDEGPREGASQDRAVVFLHRTLGADGGLEPVPGATVVVTGRDGASFTLAERALEDCAIATPENENGPGTCYAGFFGKGTFVPGEVVMLRIDLLDGSLIESVTRMPGDFDLLTPSDARCAVTPGRNFDIVWTQAQGHCWIGSSKRSDMFMIGARMTSRSIALEPSFAKGG